MMDYLAIRRKYILLGDIMDNQYTPLQLVKKIDDVSHGFSDYIDTIFSKEYMLDISNCGVFMELVIYLCNINNSGISELKTLFIWIEQVITQDDELADDVKLCFLDNLYNSVSNEKISKSAILSIIGPLTLRYLIDYQKAYIKDEYRIF